MRLAHVYATINPDMERQREEEMSMKVLKVCWALSVSYFTTSAGGTTPTYSKSMSLRALNLE